MAKMMRVYYIFNYPSIKKKVSDRNKGCDYQGFIPKRGGGGGGVIFKKKGGEPAEID